MKADRHVGTTLAVLRQTSVALSLIETSPRTISTDGCHMYANKEQSESRSPISTTCLPHTKIPLQHPHTLMYALPTLTSVLSGLQLYINRSTHINMTLIIIFFSFKSKHEEGRAEKDDRIQANWRGKGADQLFFVFVVMCWGCAHWGEVLSVGFVVKEHHAPGSWHVAHFLSVWVLGGSAYNYTFLWACKCEGVPRCTLWF